MSSSKSTEIAARLAKYTAELNTCKEKWREWNNIDLESYNNGGTGIGFETSRLIFKKYDDEIERLQAEIDKCNQELASM